MHKL